MNTAEPELHGISVKYCDLFCYELVITVCPVTFACFSSLLSTLAWLLKLSPRLELEIASGLHLHSREEASAEHSTPEF